MLRPILGIRTASYGGTYRGMAEVQAAASAEVKRHEIYTANFQGSTVETATTTNQQSTPDLSKKSGESEDHLLGGARPVKRT